MLQLFGGFGVALLDGIHDRLHHSHIPSAPADMAAQHVAHVGLRWREIISQKCRGRHQDTGRAITTLKAMPFSKILLQIVEIAVSSAKALDRVYKMPVNLDSERQAAARRHAID